MIILVLAKMGKLTKESLDILSEFDISDFGKKKYYQALVSLPDKDNKKLYWDKITTDKTLSLHDREAMAYGFFQEFQEDILKDYKDLYFNQLLDFWKNFSPDEAIMLTQALYPYIFVEQDTIDKTNNLINNKDITPEARKILMEQRDNLERTLNARKIDE
jgi:hypothetical protein